MSLKSVTWDNSIIILAACALFAGMLAVAQKPAKRSPAAEAHTLNEYISLSDYEIRTDGTLVGHRWGSGNPITIHPPFTLVENR